MSKAQILGMTCPPIMNWGAWPDLWLGCKRLFVTSWMLRAVTVTNTATNIYETVAQAKWNMWRCGPACRVMATPMLSHARHTTKGSQYNTRYPTLHWWCEMESTSCPLRGWSHISHIDNWRTTIPPPHLQVLFTVHHVNGEKQMYFASHDICLM